MNKEWAVYEQPALNELIEVAAVGSFQGGIMRAVRLLEEESQEMCQVITGTYQGYKVATRITSLLNEESKTYIVCPKKLKFIADKFSKENPPGRLNLDGIARMLPKEEPETVP